MNANEQKIDEQLYLDILKNFNSLTGTIDDTNKDVKNFEVLKNVDSFYGKDLTEIESLCNSLNEKVSRLQVVVDNYCKEIKEIEKSNISSIESIEIPKDYATNNIESISLPTLPKLEEINIPDLHVELPTITVSQPKYIEPVADTVPETIPIEEEQPIATDETPINGNTSLGGQFVIENSNFFNSSSFEDSVKGATSKVSNNGENAVTFDNNGIDFFTLSNSMNSLNTGAFSSVVNEMDKKSKESTFSSEINQRVADLLRNAGGN